VGRDPRGRAHGTRRPRARSRRDARLHDRVRPRHLGRLPGREPLRPRGPGRQPPARRGPVSRGRARRRHPGAPGRSRAGRPAGPRPGVKRFLVLAEGKSGDPHYGKTLRGVVDYGLDPVVAILDTQRAGETHKGIPIVGSVAQGLEYKPTTALVGVATQGGRFPPEWRVLLRDSISAGLDVENGLHEFLAFDPELADLAATRGVEL